MAASTVGGSVIAARGARMRLERLKQQVAQKLSGPAAASGASAAS